MVADDLNIISVADPTAPLILSSFATGGSDIAVADGYAYLALGAAGLDIIDVRAPLAPTRAGAYTDLEWVLGVEAVGDYVYLAGSDAGVVVLDVSVPAVPQLVSHLSPTPGYYYAAGTVQDVVVNGDYAYAACTHRDPYNFDSIPGLGVIDVSDPISPTQVGSYAAFSGPNGMATGVWVNGDKAYLSADEYYEGTISGWLGYSLYRVDIAAPAWQQELRGCSYSAPTSIADAALIGDYAYVAMDDVGVYGVDFGGPSEVWRYASPATTKIVSGCGRYVCALDGANLRVVDTLDSLHLQAVGHYDTGGEPKALRVLYPYAYIIVQSTDPYIRGAELQVVNISNVVSPTLEGQVEFYGEAEALWVLNGVAYVGGAAWSGATPWGRRARLWLFDVRTPAQPTLTSMLAPFSEGQDYSFVRDIWVEGKTAYILSQIPDYHSTHFSKLDVQDAANPKFIVSTTLPGWCHDLAARGDWVYVSGVSDPLGESHPVLWPIHFTDPEFPDVQSEIVLPTSAADLDMERGYLLAALGQSGVYAFDVRDGIPAFAASYDTEGAAEGVNGCSPYVQVADGYNGLVMLWLTAPMPLYLPALYRG